MKHTIYAKTLNPEFFDYRIYEYDIKEDNDIMLVGNDDYSGINEDLFKDIVKMAEEYGGYEYEVYYHNSIKEFLADMFPKKENGKKLSQKEVSLIKKALDGYNYDKTYHVWIEEVALCSLRIIKGKEYTHKELRGYCQGEWIQAFYPVDTDSLWIDYIEAWFFGTGNEVMVHTEDSKVESPDDIDGFTFYTSSWKVEDIKREVIEHYGLVTREGDEVEVVLWEFTGYDTIKVDKYQLAS